MDDIKIEKLVEELDKELGKHDLSFDEYLLYRAIRIYEHRDPAVMKKLEEKGLIKDEKVIDEQEQEKINHFRTTVINFFTQMSKPD